MCKNLRSLGNLESVSDTCCIEGTPNLTTLGKLKETYDLLLKDTHINSLPNFSDAHYRISIRDKGSKHLEYMGFEAWEFLEEVKVYETATIDDLIVKVTHENNPFLLKIIKRRLSE